MADHDTTPKLHIDSDWKAEAQKEKERLAQKEQAKTAKAAPTAAGAPAAGDPRRAEHELPEPSFRSLVGMLASQAIMGLGAMADPETNRVVIDLEGARFAIDLLDVLEQKTKGNLAEDEKKELAHVLAELRSRFVQIAELVKRQMAAQGNDSLGAGPVKATGAGPSGKPVSPLRL